MQKTAPATDKDRPQGTAPLSAKQKAELSHLTPEFTEFLYSKESTIGPNKGNEAVRQYIKAQEINGWDSSKYVGTENERKFKSIETRLRLAQDIPYERRGGKAP